MLIIWAVAIFISIIYILVILYFTIGWFKIPIFNSNENQITTGVSVIIPIRNEQNTILNLLEDISKQNFNSNLYEVFIVDDNSTDNSISLVDDYIKDLQNFSIISLENKTGKKEAIGYGVSMARNELIITTDADCRVNNNWLRTFVSFYEEYHPKMIIGAVKMESHNLFGHLQSLEFLSLVASTAGAVGIKRPIMSNGANLVFEKSVYNEVFSHVDKDIVSGDDIFLMHLFKKRFKEKIMYLKSEDFIVRTSPTKTLSEFINQRIRWTSKSKNYKDFDTIFTSILVLLMNISIMIFGICSIIDFEQIYPFILLFSCKLIVDFVLLASVSKFFKSSILLLYFIPLQLLYPFYICFVGISGNLIPYNWKDRKNLHTRY